MDGIEGTVKRSLQFRLSARVSCVILVVALAAGAFSFYRAFQDAIELQDDQLRQMVAVLHRQHIAPAHVDAQQHIDFEDAEARIVVQPLPPPGAPAVALPGELPGIPTDLAEGFHNVPVAGRTWRIYVRSPDPLTRIAVGQQAVVRDEIARDSALRTVAPLLILIPILLLLVGDLIRTMLKPLKDMAAELDRRSEQSLHEIEGRDLPAEIVPFVVAINRLLARVAQSVAVQRRFVADAAHELRSPLTALSLQSELLQATDMSAEAAQRLVTLRLGIQRARHLLDQLLDFARVQGSLAVPAAPVSMQVTLRSVLEDLMPLVHAKNIDIGVTSAHDQTVPVQESDLRMLFKNLLENAIRYSPPGGRIDLSVQAHPHTVTLRIEDSGPGIPESERERVFDAFYRILGREQAGSGLGLSIVKTIADRHGATLALAYTDAQARCGLRVDLTFARQVPQAERA
jgi:two-component system OmpR family sensor kinase